MTKKALCLALMLVAYSCVSKPEPWSPDGKTKDGVSGEVLSDSTGGTGDVGIPDYEGPPVDVVQPTDVVEADGIEPTDALTDVIAPDQLGDVADALKPPDSVTEDVEKDQVEEDTITTPAGPPVVRPAVFVGTSSGGGFSLVPALVAGQSGQSSTGGGLVLKSAVVVDSGN